MPEPADQASARRANWVGLRTMRQRPKVIDTLPDGEPVYEVRGVRLVLRGQSTHFNRLVACERCGRGQAGSPILGPADLDAPPRPIICGDCVRRAGVTSVWDADAPRVPPRPSPVAASAAPAPTPSRAKEPEPPPAPEPEPDRVEGLEQRLAAVVAEVAKLRALTETQRAALQERGQRDEQTLTTLRTAMGQAIGEVRSELTSAVQANAARLDGLEAAWRDRPADAEPGLPVEWGQRQEQALVSFRTAVGQAIEQVRSELASAVQANTARLDALEAHLHDRPADTPLGLSAEWGQQQEQALEQARTELAAAVQANAARLDGLEAAWGDRPADAAPAVSAEWEQQQDQALASLRTAVGEAFEQLRTEVSSAVQASAARAEALEAQLGVELARLTPTIDAQRADISALATVVNEVRSELAGIVEAHVRLAEAHGRLEGNVGALRQASPAAPGPNAAFEAQLGQVAEQVSHLSKRLDAAIASTDERVRGRDAHRQRGTTPGREIRPETRVDLLDDLERQLHGASTRLAAMSGTITRDTAPGGDAASNGDDRNPAHHPG